MSDEKDPKRAPSFTPTFTLPGRVAGRGRAQAQRARGTSRPSFTPKIPAATAPRFTPNIKQEPQSSSSRHEGGESGHRGRGRGDRYERGRSRGNRAPRGDSRRGDRGRGGDRRQSSIPSATVPVIPGRVIAGTPVDISALAGLADWAAETAAVKDEPMEDQEQIAKAEEAQVSEKKREKQAALQRRNQAWARNQNVPTILPWEDPFTGAASKSSVLRDSDAGHLFLDEESGQVSDSRLFVVQLPPVLPKTMQKQDEVDYRDVGLSAKKAPVTRTQGCPLEWLPEGQVGKMRIHKSGKVSMEVNGVRFIVQPGTKCSFAQQVAVIDVEKESFTVLGNVRNTMLVVPDYEDILKTM